MTNLKKVFVLTLAVVLIGVGVAGAATEDVELTLWKHSLTTGQVSDEYISWFEKTFAEKYPNITLKKSYGPGLYRDMKQKFLMQAKTGSPDVIEGVFANIATYQKAGQIAPLTKYFENWGQSDQFYQSTIDALHFKGKQWGIPYNTNARCLLYRESILKKYNLPVPKTWEEFIEVASTITEKEPGMNGFSFTSKRGEVRAWQEFMSWYFQLNDPMYAYSQEKGRWVLKATEAQLEQVLGLYQDLLFATDPPAVSMDSRGGDWKALDYGYTSGKFAMVPMGPWIYGHRLENESRAEVIYDTGITALPKPENGRIATFMEVKPYMLNKFSKNKEAGWKLIQFMASKQNMVKECMDEGFNPTRKDVANSKTVQSDWWQKGFLKQLPTAVAAAPINWEPPRRTVVLAIQQVIYKEKTPSEAA